MPYPFSNLTTTSTFTQWYTLTNEMSTFLNDQVVANGVTAAGTFVLGPNATLAVCNTTFVNTSLFRALSNVALGNTSTGYVQILGDLFSVAANVALLNPISSVFVNTALTVNATSNFVGNAAFANVTVGGTLVGVNARLNGNLTTNNGTVITRGFQFTTNGASVNSALASAGYADYTVSGLESAILWNATPGQNTVISGIDAHTTVSSSTDGSRILFLQNLSTSYKITLSAANTSSTATHRFETVGNLSVDVEPRQTVLLIYSKDAQRWRVVGGQTTGGNTSFSALTTGVLSVSGNAAFSANLAADPLYVNAATGRVGIGTATPTAKFHSVGPNVLDDITTADTLRSDTLVVTAGANIASANVRFASNGIATFDNIINVTSVAVSTIANLATGTLTSNGTITGVTLTGVNGTFSGTVSAPTGTFNTLGTVNGAIATISGNVTTGNVVPQADVTYALGSASRRWITPFFSLANGAGDGTMLQSLVTGTTGEVKSIEGYTGTQLVATKTWTFKAGLLVSVV